MKKLIFLLTAVVLMTANSACSSKKQNQEAETNPEVSHATLVVQGSCEICKDRIEKAAQSEEGVASAEWNAESKELHLQFDAAKTSVEAISKAIAKVGYDTEKDKAADEVYDALAPCCKYRS
jgi:Cu(I)/Ag(I) efflux system membrane fusion protein